MKEIELEKKRLKETIEIINKLYEDEQIDLEKLYKEFIGDREELWRIADQKKIHISNLEVAKDKPYFARIDFTATDDGKTSTIYIGKNGIIKNNNIVVTDWRAPISSLYYDSEIGNCSYEAPSGTINGNMNLKRQYEIEKGQLIDYFDVELVANDSLLQRYLNSNNDSRLKSIVSTIQKEQNEVIRKKISDDLIIQGVAGSGKTTVALHRIAYLVYNYIKSIKQNQYLVIGPNPVFLKYIKSVLPELDVSGVRQCTFEQLAQDYINENIEINSSEQKVISSISGNIMNDIDKFKCSTKYKNMIDKFLNIYICSLTSSDIMIGDFKVIDKTIIKEVFNTTNTSSNLRSRIELTIDRLCKIIENTNSNIISRYSDYSFEKFKTTTSTEEKEKMRKKFAKEREEIRKNCRSTIRKYFSKAKIDSTRLYKLFISTINDFDIYNYPEIKQLKKETLQNIKLSKYAFEDLAALMYIKSVISPDKDYERIEHVVIDEAQDLGEFNFVVLKKCLRHATFSIFGDLAQSIYDYRGIDNWDDVNNVMFNNNGQIIKFGKSYRTTTEIMTVADEVSDSIGLGKSDITVRHGNPIEFSKIDNVTDIPEYIIKKINKYKAKGYKTIAIISKTDLLSDSINKELAKKGLFISNVGLNDDLSDDKFKICTISNQLAKGLEFDAVIINDASESIYSSTSKLDMKLLYVAITRALHEVDIIYSGELTKPLIISSKKNNDEYIKTLKK